MRPLPPLAEPLTTDWITSVATAVGAVGTIGLLYWAIKLWRGDRREARRAQATFVHGYSDGGTCFVVNRSGGPVYEVTLHRSEGMDVPLTAIIPPGDKYATAVDFGGKAEPQGRKVTIAFSFTDQAAVRWRWEDGGLEETPKGR